MDGETIMPLVWLVGFFAGFYLGYRFTWEYYFGED